MRTHPFFLGGGGAGPIVNFVSLPLSPLDHLSVRACVDIDWLGSWLRDRYYACQGSKKQVVFCKVSKRKITVSSSAFDLQ